jgi:hypothetical protein
MLYYYKRFDAAWKEAKRKNGSRRTRENTDVEFNGVDSYSEVEQCNCGQIATQEIRGTDYCRDCYLAMVQKDQDEQLPPG